MKLLSIRSCEGFYDEQVIDLDLRANIRLTKDCHLLSYGSVKWQSFNAANITYQVYRNDRLIKKEEFDMCNAEIGENGMVIGILQSFGLPTTCPVSAVSFKKLKQKLKLKNIF